MPKGRAKFGIAGSVIPSENMRDIAVRMRGQVGGIDKGFQSKR